MLVGWKLETSEPAKSVKRCASAETEQKEETAPVNVLGLADGLNDSSLSIRVDTLTKRELNEDPVHASVGVALLHLGDDLLDGRRLGQGDERARHAGLLGGFELHLDVRRRVGSVASLKDDQVGLEAGVLGLDLSDLGRDLGSDVPVSGQ